MKLSRLTLILVLSVTGYAQQATPTPATQNVTSPTATSQTGGTVIFYREGHFTGSALKPSVFLDGKEVARLKNGTYVMAQVEPGKHQAESSAKHEPALTIDVKPGEITYIEMIVVSGTWRGAGRLIPVPADDGKVAVSKLHLLD